MIDSGRCSGLKGKTPEATISAMLAVGSKSGGPFKRVGKGTYTVADRPAAAAKPAQPAAASKQARTRKSAPAQKPGAARPKRQAAKRSR